MKNVVNTVLVSAQKLLPVIAAVVLVGCESLDITSTKRVLVTEPDLTEMRISSEAGWTSPIEENKKTIPAFRGTWQDDGTTQLFAVEQNHYGIKGFEFEEGYRCELVVKECHYKNPPSDFLNRWYELAKVKSKTKAE